MSATQFRSRVAAAIGLVALALGGCAPPAGSVSALASSPPECQSFGGGIVQAASWSEGGEFVAAIVQGREGATSIVVFSWPDMKAVSHSATATYSTDTVAIDKAGAVYWLSSDPMSPVTESTVWRKRIDAPAEALGVASGAFLSLYWGNGLLAAQVLGADQIRLVRFDVDKFGAPLPLIEDGPTVSEMWIDRSGRWLVREESDGPGNQQELVVRHDDTEQRLKLPGYGGRSASITPDHASVIYQRSETARFTVVDVASGQLRGELDQRSFYGGEISSKGILAALTAHGPNEPNQLCVFDVNARLASLTSGAVSPPPLPPLPPEDFGQRDAFVRALRAAEQGGGSVRLGTVLPGQWRVMNFFKPYFDNVTAANALGYAFDLEAALKSLRGEPGVIVTLDDGREVLAWFALPADVVDTTRVAGGGFGAPECLSVGLHDGRPALTGIASC